MEFLTNSGMIISTVTDDLMQGRLELPCKYTFTGPDDVAFTGPDDVAKMAHRLLNDEHDGLGIVNSSFYCCKAGLSSYP